MPYIHSKSLLFLPRCLACDFQGALTPPPFHMTLSVHLRLWQPSELRCIPDRVGRRGKIMLGKITEFSAECRQWSRAISRPLDLMSTLSDQSLPKPPITRLVSHCRWQGPCILPGLCLTFTANMSSLCPLPEMFYVLISYKVMESGSFQSPEVKVFCGF